MSTRNQQLIEGMLGTAASAFGAVLWVLASLETHVSSGAVFVALSYLWLILIFGTIVWLAHRAKRQLTRNIAIVLGCVLFLLDTTCWVGLQFGGIRIGG